MQRLPQTILISLLTITVMAGQDKELPKWEVPKDAISLAGVVKFNGTPPKRSVIDLKSSKQAYFEKLYEKEPLLTEEVLVQDGGLANVYVRIKNAPKYKYPIPSEAVVLDQKGGRYVPRVFGIQVGQRLLVRNSDPVHRCLQKLDGPNPGVFRHQDKGAPDVEYTPRYATTLDEVDKWSSQCCSWMVAYMHVSEHPFFAVSTDAGRFEIKNLPPGEYELEAWHERLGTRTLKVKLPDDNGKVVIEFEKQQ